MELQLNVNVRYIPQRTVSIGAVLRHLESAAWVRLVLRQVLPQLRRNSPTDPGEITRMVLEADSTNINTNSSNNSRSGDAAEQPVACGICMATSSTTAATTTPAASVWTPITLPCGHRFHSGCAQSWLRRRSTCPLCRFQLPAAYTGTYAITSVRSTLVLPRVRESLGVSDLESVCIGGGDLHAVVKVVMVRMNADVDETGLSGTRRRQPCEVNAEVVRVHGGSVPAVVGRSGKRQREETLLEAPGSVVKRARAAAW